MRKRFRNIIRAGRIPTRGIGPASGFVAAAWCLGGLACGLGAAETLSLQRRVVNQVEMGLVTWCDVRSRLGAFTFIPPAGWHLQTRADQESLMLHSPDLLTSLEIKFEVSKPGPARSDRVTLLRQGLLKTYPEAVIVEEFPCHTSADPGHAFDLHYAPKKQVEMAVRAVLAPCPQGAVEFHLVARKEKIVESYHVFGAVLTSFSRIDKDVRQPPQ